MTLNLTVNRQNGLFLTVSRAHWGPRGSRLTFPLRPSSSLLFYFFPWPYTHMARLQNPPQEIYTQ